MAVTVDVLKRTKFSTLFAVLADVTFDSSYPTGGEAVSPPQLGLQSVDFVSVSSADGYIVEYDYANGKLIARTPTNVSDGEAAAAAPADEVANATDLSAVTVRVLAIGV